MQNAKCKMQNANANGKCNRLSVKPFIATALFILMSIQPTLLSVRLLRFLTNNDNVCSLLASQVIQCDSVSLRSHMPAQPSPGFLLSFPTFPTLVRTAQVFLNKSGQVPTVLTIGNNPKVTFSILVISSLIKSLQISLQSMQCSVS